MYPWQFSKNFPLPKNGGHFEFSNFCFFGKTQICFYLLNRARYNDFVEIFDPQGIRAMYSWQFQKLFPSPKMAAILNFCQKWQNTKLLLSP